MFNRKIIKYCKEMWNNPEIRYKLIKEKKEFWKDPEYRKNVHSLPGVSKNPSAISVEIDGIFYDCKKDATTALGINSHILNRRLNSPEYPTWKTLDRTKKEE